MANVKLSSSDVKHLLATYESKQRRLQFEMEHVKGLVRNLKNALPALERAEAEQAEQVAAAADEIETISAPPAAAENGSVKRPRKKAADRKTKKKTAEKKDRSSGYRLSEYDELLFDTLRENDRAMINSEIVEYVEQKQREKGLEMAEGEVQTMIVRSLQKLANRRKEIRKVPYEGRGMAYALPEWLNAQGEIKKKHARK